MKKMVLFLVLAAPLMVQCPPPRIFYESNDSSRASGSKDHYCRFDRDGYWYELQLSTYAVAWYDVTIRLTIRNEEYDRLEYNPSSLQVTYHDAVQPLRRLGGDCGSAHSDTTVLCTIGRGEEISLWYELWDNENTARPEKINVCVGALQNLDNGAFIRFECVAFTAPAR